MLEQVRAGGLLPAGASVVVLLSGGRDSVCLLDVAVRAVGDAGTVAAVHVNYGLRDEAGDDERHCAALCEQLGVELAIERPRRPEAGGNIQAWARDVRYAVATRLALGRDRRRRRRRRRPHRRRPGRDDPLPAGLLAEPPCAAGHATARRAARAPAARRHARARRPPTASSAAWPGATTRRTRGDGYARNRVRHGLVPALEQIHPAAAANVLRTARAAARRGRGARRARRRAARRTRRALRDLARAPCGAAARAAAARRAAARRRRRGQARPGSREARRRGRRAAPARAARCSTSAAACARSPSAGCCTPSAGDLHSAPSWATRRSARSWSNRTICSTASASWGRRSRATTPAENRCSSCVLKGAVFFLSDLMRAHRPALRGRLHGGRLVRLGDPVLGRGADPQGSRRGDRGPRRAHRRGHRRLRPDARSTCCATSTRASRRRWRCARC